MIPGLHLAGLHDAKVPATKAGFLDPEGEVFFAVESCEFPAGRAWLGDLYEGVADAEDVADADVFFHESTNAEVFAEGAGAEGFAQAFEPVGEVRCRIDADGFFWASVVFEVGLAVADKVRPFKLHGRLHGLFGKAGAPGAFEWIGGAGGAVLGGCADL